MKFTAFYQYLDDKQLIQSSRCVVKADLNTTMSDEEKSNILISILKEMTGHEVQVIERALRYR
ncbi:hypothetical protein [Lysinibacillus sp. 54212]|uniref:hypothetical protein n=1 Tax=Lysinibacillus sp. 54212 TaxID=3119829 RepID=UPI002FC5BB3A